MNSFNNTEKKAPSKHGTHSLAASVGLIVFLTILARPFGLFREILTATFFGTKRELDSFLLAASLPVFLCTILGGGLVQAIVPGLSAASEEDQEKGWSLLTRLASLFAILTIPFILLNILLAPHIVPLLFPSQALPETLTTGINVYRLIAPAILGAILAGLFVGSANTFHLYGHTTLRSVAYNAMIIISLIFFHKSLGIYSLGVGILLAEYSQLLIVLPPLWKKGYRFQTGSKQIGNYTHIVFSTFVPAIFLTGMGHINYLVDRILGMPLGEGCVSSLHYAWKLILLPASLLSVAFATPLLTFLSRHEARKERKETGLLFGKTAGTLLFFSIPVTFLLLLCRREIISLFYGWGRFDQSGVSLTSSALLFYSPGLPFQLLLPLFVAGFLAVKKPWIPVLVSLPLVPLNWFLDCVLMQHFSHAGIAFSTSLVFFINVIILFALLKRSLIQKKVIPYGLHHFLFLFGSAVFFSMIWWAYASTKHMGGTSRLGTLVELMIIGMITLGGYFIMAHAFGIESVKRLGNFITGIKKSKENSR